MKPLKSLAINGLGKKAPVLICLFLLTACSTTRLKYEATLVDDYFHTAQFEYQNSYAIEDKAQKCWMTAIFLGGTCWTYLGGPDELLKEKLKLDAYNKVEEIFGPNNFKHRNISIDRYGWNDLPEDYAFPSGSPLKNNYPFLHHEQESQKDPRLMVPSKDSSNVLGEEK